ELLTTVLVTILYACFAYKNLGAIEATAEERQAILLAIKDYPDTGTNAADVKRVRERLEPVLPPYDIAGPRSFPLACDLLTWAFLGVKERRRQNPNLPPAPGAAEGARPHAQRARTCPPAGRAAAERTPAAAARRHRTVLPRLAAGAADL